MNRTRITQIILLIILLAVTMVLLLVVYRQTPNSQQAPTNNLKKESLVVKNRLISNEEIELAIETSSSQIKNEQNLEMTENGIFSDLEIQTMLENRNGNERESDSPVDDDNIETVLDIEK